MIKCYIDFETQSEVDLKKVGATAYALHPSTRIVCMAFALPSSNVVQVYEPNNFEADILQNIGWVQAQLEKQDFYFIAHNAYFDATIWNEVATRQFGFPRVPYSKWRCTAAKAAYYNLPSSLEGACEALDLEIKKDKVGAEAMKRIMSPAIIKKVVGQKKDKPVYEKETKLLNYEDAPEDFDRVYEYCKIDVEAMIGLDQKLWDDIPEIEHKYWVHTCNLNRKGIQVDISLAERATILFEEYKTRANAKALEISNGTIQNSNSSKQVKELAAREGYELTSLTRTAIEEFLKDDTVPQVLRDILTLKIATNKSSAAKYQRISEMQLNGRVHDLLRYYGASTGRMSGQGIQVQNLPKGDLKMKYDIEGAVLDAKTLSFDQLTHKYGDVAIFLIAIIRHAVRATDGNKFIVADFASVEPRMLALISGQEDLLEAFRNNAKIYEAQAAFTFKMKVEDVKPGSKERFVGKTQVLACGYSMGAKKFQTYCAIQNQHFTLDFCQQAIDAYREKNFKIKEFWKTQETNVRKVIRKLEARATDGVLTWYMRKEFLCCRLPSGRTLHYFKPRLTPKKFTYKGEEKSGTNIDFLKPFHKQVLIRNIYGGLITENITQALCRDVLMENILKCEEAGYSVAFHVHDEVIAEIPEGFGSISEFDKILCSVPKWAEGFPIATGETWVGKRYKKD